MTDGNATVVAYENILRSSVMILAAQTQIDGTMFLELGMAVLYDKPLIVLVPPGVVVSLKLRVIATEIIEVPEGNGEWDMPTFDAFKAAMKRVFRVAIRQAR